MNAAFLITYRQFGVDERIVVESRPQLDELTALIKQNPLAREVRYFTLSEITPGATPKAARPPSNKEKQLTDAANALRARGVTDQELLVFFQAAAAAMRQGNGLGGAQISAALGLVS